MTRFFKRPANPQRPQRQRRGFGFRPFTNPNQIRIRTG
jgi:hypothetical protein